MDVESHESTLPIDEQPVSDRARQWCIRWLFPIARGFTSSIGSAAQSIGRERDCDIVLPNGRVSRKHAELRIEGRNVLLRDLRSRNGTFVDGTRVEHALLRAGNLIRIGDWIGIVAQQSGDDANGASKICDGFYGGAALQRVLTPVRAAAKTDLPILIEGATGTGKERTARAIHEWSGRSGRFVAINCAALPENLAEAELFGYRKGAFTGAESGSMGHFRAADKGTLFLDEVRELGRPLQAKLLRALELGEIQPLGETRSSSVDVRIVAAVQGDLAGAVAGGQFRADLHARLNGLTVRLPALADRREEIPALFAQLVADRSGGTSPELETGLIEQLCLYHWPGNVRELELLVRRLLGLHGHDQVLRVAHLVDTNVRRELPNPDPRPLIEMDSVADGVPRDEREIALLLAGLRVHEGNLARAAAHAGISRQRAYRLLQARPELDLEALRRQVAR